MFTKSSVTLILDVKGYWSDNIRTSLWASCKNHMEKNISEAETGIEKNLLILVTLSIMFVSLFSYQFSRQTIVLIQLVADVSTFYLKWSFYWHYNWHSRHVEATLWTVSSSPLWILLLVPRHLQLSRRGMSEHAVTCVCTRVRKRWSWKVDGTEQKLSI